MAHLTTTFWTIANGFPGVTARAAVRAEAAGWDGIWVPDSQNLTGDPYVALALAAARTTQILVGTGVTNPLTRHPAVTAASIATVHEESGGRAVLGIGRGDSSLAYLGLAPAPVPVFTRYLERVQGYLRREEVPFEINTDGRGMVSSVEALDLAGGPRGSQLRWLLHADQPKVPVDVVASGPRVIAAGATRAERLTLAVGADPVRVRWGADIARNARRDVGLDPDGVELGAVIPVAVHDDEGTARRLAAASLPIIARFSVMHGRVTGPVSSQVRAKLEAVHKAYDMNKHGRHGRQAEIVDDDLIDAFCVAGPAPYCVERLLELKELGVRSFHLHSGWFSPDPPAEDDPWLALADTVLPALR